MLPLERLGNDSISASLFNITVVFTPEIAIESAQFNVCKGLFALPSFKSLPLDDT